VNVCILTTDTPHHRYFLQEVVRCAPPGIRYPLVLFEDAAYPWQDRSKRWIRSNVANPWRAFALNPYLQPRSFAKKQHAFELSKFFPGNRIQDPPKELAILRVHSCNESASIEALRAAAADLIFVYGTGRLLPEVYRSCSTAAFNAHGGRLPQYRGLDTNLWAALDRKFEDICVTIHHVAEKLDTGDVVLEREIEPDPLVSIYSLRYFSALVCVELFLELVTSIVQGRVPEIRPRPVDAVGRYFGPMPWLLKLRADARLREWVNSEPARRR
jgi:hypothetical protein